MNKLEIWGNTVPGNTGKNKRDFMELKQRKKANIKWDTIRWMFTVKGGRFKDRKRLIDTYTDTWVKKMDPDYHEKFEDIPYLIPYIAPGSKKAVIVVPGGAYCTKGMDGEGTDIAEKLQKNGITAFVLWYRSNPYYQPYPLMDMQRAIRYVRYQAEKYGYHKDKVGAIGFSAGGAQVSLFLNILKGGKITLPSYDMDEIDMTDDTLNFFALLYPALNYNYNKTMMFASFPAEKVRDTKTREELMAVYDAVMHMNCAGIPQFICYGTKDTMISVPTIKQYIEILKQSGTAFKEIQVSGAGHGFGAAKGTQYEFWLEEYIEWLKVI